MADEQNEHVVIEHLDRVDYASLEPMVDAFQAAGISVRVREEEPGDYGSMGAFAELPTVVQVIVVAAAGAAGKALLQEAGKDLYGALKRGFGAIWNNLRHTSDRGFSPRYSMKLSIIWEFRDGTRLKLLLHPNSQAHDAETALEQFRELVKLKLDALDSRSQVQIWVFNPESNKLEPIDPEDDDE